MPYDKRKRTGSRGADGGPVQRRVGPGKRTLTSQLPASVQARTEDQRSLGPRDPTPPTMVGPGHGSPIPPIEEIRKYYVQRDDAGQTEGPASSVRRAPPPASSGEIVPGRDSAVYDHAGKLEQLADSRDPSNPNNALTAREMYEAWRNLWSSRDAQAKHRLQGLKDRMRSEDALGYAEKKERFDSGLRDALGPDYAAAENQAALCHAELSSMEEVFNWLEGQETLGRHVTLDQVSRHALEWAHARDKYGSVIMTLFLLAYPIAAAGGGTVPESPGPVAEGTAAEGTAAEGLATEEVVTTRAGGQEAAATGVAQGFTAAESAIIEEARAIVGAPEFAELRAAHSAEESASIRINGRLIQYEPGLPASGMTMFGEDGFLIGREAFATQAELGKTVLHELYRLSTSASAGGVSGSLASSETAAAFSFAERAIGELF